MVRADSGPHRCYRHFLSPCDVLGTGIEGKRVEPGRNHTLGPAFHWGRTPGEKAALILWLIKRGNACRCTFARWRGAVGKHSKSTFKGDPQHDGVRRAFQGALPSLQKQQVLIDRQMNHSGADYEVGGHSWRGKGGQRWNPLCLQLMMNSRKAPSGVKSSSSNYCSLCRPPLSAY